MQVEHFPKISIFTGFKLLKCKEAGCPAEFPALKSTEGVIKTCALTDKTKEQIVRDGLKKLPTIAIYKSIDSVRTGTETSVKKVLIRASRMK